MHALRLMAWWVIVAMSTGCLESPGPSAPSQARPFDWDVTAFGTGHGDDEGEEEPPPYRCSGYSAWAPPNFWGGTYSIGQTWANSGYTVTAAAASEGQAVTGRLTYYATAGETTSQFAVPANLAFVTGNAIGHWVTVRFISTPLGSLVNGHICGSLLDET